VPKCLKQFGTTVHETLQNQNKNMLQVCYIRYSNGMEVLGKRLKKVVSD